MKFLDKLDKKMKKKLAIVGVLIVIAAILCVIYAPQLIALAKEPKVLADYLASFGYLGWVIFIVFEIIQVIIALIPGDLFHISAGFIYNMPLGFILAYLGEVLGAFIAFGLAKYFGADIVKKFTSEENIEKLSKLINSARGTVGILVLCLIPAIPKDILLYVAGITPIKPSRFLTVYLLCRIPDIFIKASSGAAIVQQDYVSLAIIVGAFLLFVAVGWLLKKKFIKPAEEQTK